MWLCWTIYIFYIDIDRYLLFMFSTLARCRYSCRISLLMLVKKVSSEKTCFQTGASEMLFTDAGCVRRDLVGVCRSKRRSIRVIT